jgi:CheY-like chemotaxis protein
MAETNPVEIAVVEDSREDADPIGVVLQEHQIDCRMHVIRDGATAIQLLDALDSDPSAPQLDLFIVDINVPNTAERMSLSVCDVPSGSLKVRLSS